MDKMTKPGDCKNRFYYMFIVLQFLIVFLESSERIRVFLYRINCSAAQKNGLNQTNSVGNFLPLDFYYHVTWILT